MRSIMDEVASWTLGKYFRLHYWRGGGESNNKCMMYNGWDIQQDGVLDVERRLGTGGMGHVHIACNKENGQVVAVKVGKKVRIWGVLVCDEDDSPS